MSLCPAFWCSRCHSNHADECVDQPGMSFLGRRVGTSLGGPKWPLVDTYWVGELSDDDGKTWRPNHWEYYVVDVDSGRPKGIVGGKGRGDPTTNSRHVFTDWKESERPVEAWSTDGYVCGSDANPNRRMRLKPRP